MSLKYRYTVTFNDGEIFIFDNDRSINLADDWLQVTTNTEESISIPTRSIKKIHCIRNKQEPAHAPTSR